MKSSFSDSISEKGASLRFDGAMLPTEKHFYRMVASYTMTVQDYLVPLSSLLTMQMRGHASKLLFCMRAAIG